MLGAPKVSETVQFPQLIIQNIQFFKFTCSEQECANLDVN